MWYWWCVDTSSAAALVRAALRGAGCLEWEPGRRGFQVEGDPEGGWVVVTCIPGVRKGSAALSRELQRYRDILWAAGFSVTDSPYRPGVLRITLPPAGA
jgi:hypothetical protein